MRRLLLLLVVVVVVAPVRVPHFFFFFFLGACHAGGARAKFYINHAISRGRACDFGLWRAPAPVLAHIWMEGGVHGD